MAEYVILGLVFMAIVAMIIFATYRKISWRRILFVMAIVVFATAIFDSLIIAADIVRYDHASILGIYVWRAPIEDFFYAIAVSLLIPILWEFANDRKV